MGKPGRKPDPEVAARRAKVKKLRDEDKTKAEIAAILDLAPATVASDLSILKRCGE